MWGVVVGVCGVICSAWTGLSRCSNLARFMYLRHSTSRYQVTQYVNYGGTMADRIASHPHGSQCREARVKEGK